MASISAFSTVVLVGGIVRRTIAIVLKDKLLPLSFNVVIFFATISVITQSTKIITLLSGISLIIIFGKIPKKIRSIGGEIRQSW